MAQDRFSKPAYKAFAAALESACGTGHVSRFNLFSDYAEMAFIAMSQPVRKWLTGSIDAGREKRYKAIAKKYPNPKAFAEAHGILVASLEEERHDFLGAVAGEMGILEGEWRGQFFTPQPICAMIAAMTLGDEKPNPDHRLTICEPSVGAGGMVIAVAVELVKRGFHPVNWRLDATDVDSRMFHAAYVQLSLCGVPGIVRHANTLSGEQWEAEFTVLGAMFMLRRDSTREQVEAAVAKSVPSGQLQLL